MHLRPNEVLQPQGGNQVLSGPGGAAKRVHGDPPGREQRPADLENYGVLRQSQQQRGQRHEEILRLHFAVHGHLQAEHQPQTFVGHDQSATVQTSDHKVPAAGRPIERNRTQDRSWHVSDRRQPTQGTHQKLRQRLSLVHLQADSRDPAEEIHELLADNRGSEQQTKLDCARHVELVRGVLRELLRIRREGQQHHRGAQSQSRRPEQPQLTHKRIQDKSQRNSQDQDLGVQQQYDAAKEKAGGRRHPI